MRNTRVLLIVCTLACLPWNQPASAQYGGNQNSSNSETSNTRSRGNGQGNANNDADPNDRRRRTIGTSVDEETSEERERRRDEGIETVDRGAPPGIAKGPEIVGKAEESAWGELTAEQQTAAIEELKRFGEDTRAKVNPNLALNETKYFLFYSDLKPAEATRWANMLDRMYLKLAGLFGIKGGENIFRGKAAVFVFAKEEDYQNFQKTMHDTDATGTAGLCHCFGNGDVHIGFFRQPNEMDFAAVLVHESVHGFLHRYKKPPVVPTWVNEGLAETIASELVPQRGKRQEYRQHAITQLRERGTLGAQFFTGDRLDGWQYPVAQLLTEFMIKQDKKRYVAFIDGIKDGMNWEDALATKYGAPQDRLVAAFADSLNVRGIGSAKPANDRRRPQQGRDDTEERERAEERQ
ncbi:MAG TPA: hypothetical protein VGR35_13255 [Tepidisphaeraceae bacterium]|nr:hypothetical protein [Tepidisphaeraceae bacterium]